MKREILKLKVRPRRHFPFSHALDEAVHCILEVITLVGMVIIKVSTFANIIQFKNTWVNGKWQWAWRLWACGRLKNYCRALKSDWNKELPIFLCKELKEQSIHLNILRHKQCIQSQVTLSEFEKIFEVFIKRSYVWVGPGGNPIKAFQSFKSPD